MFNRSSLRLRVLLPCISAVLLLTLVGLVRADDSNGADICVDNDGLLVDKAKLNGSIQKKLGEIYKQNKCYQKYAGSESTPLKDGVMGVVTKKWINQALSDHSISCPQIAKCEPEPPAKPLSDFDEGLGPYILLQKDLNKLTINRPAAEILNQFLVDQDEDDFITQQDVLDSATGALSVIENITDDILNSYREDLRALIKGREVHQLGQGLIDRLISSGRIEEAKALKPLVGLVKLPKRLALDVTNSLTELATEKQKQYLKEIESREKDEDKRLEAKSKQGEEKVSAELKTKLRELAIIDKDEKGLLGIIKYWGESIVDSVKIGPITIDTVIEDIPIPTEKEFEKIVDEMLGRKIAESLKYKLEFEQAGKVADAASEAKNLYDLKRLYADEKQRLVNNIEIKKQNAELEEKQKALEAKKQRVKSDRAKAADSIKIADVDSIVANAKVYQRYYIEKTDFTELWPSLDPSVSACAEKLVDYVYPSRDPMSSALTFMLKRSNTVADDQMSTDTKGFTCELAGEQSKECLVMLKDNKWQLCIASSSIKLDVLPGCTNCSIPMKGTIYGFYPYWNSLDSQEQMDPNTIKRGALDLSLFTRMAFLSLLLDDDGSISRSHWEVSGKVLNVVETLKKYNVKRDVVLYFKDWCHWGEQVAGAECSKADDDITPNTLGDYSAEKYAKSHYRELKGINDKVKSMGGIDGITLYFDDYTSAVDASNIVTYVQALKNEMTRGEESANTGKRWQPKINLLLGIKFFDPVKVNTKVCYYNPSYFRKIAKLFVPKFSESQLNPSDIMCADALKLKLTTSPPVDKLLVFLNGDTSAQKKFLRTLIENEFSGVHRVSALRSVIPILSLSEREGIEGYRQYKDDIAYLKDNFGGIGIWNPMLSKSEGNHKKETVNEPMQILSHELKRSFLNSSNELGIDRSYIDYEKLGFVGEWLYKSEDKFKFSVCGHVCPHRDIYRWIFIFLFCGNLITELLWRTNCTARTQIAKLGQTHNFLRLSVIVLFFALLGCDPAWQENSNRILFIPIVTMVVLGLYLLFGRSYEKDI